MEKTTNEQSSNHTITGNTIYTTAHKYHHENSTANRIGIDIGTQSTDTTPIMKNININNTVINGHQEGTQTQEFDGLIRSAPDTYSVHTSTTDVGVIPVPANTKCTKQLKKAKNIYKPNDIYIPKMKVPPHRSPCFDPRTKSGRQHIDHNSADHQSHDVSKKQGESSKGFDTTEPKRNPDCCKSHSYAPFHSPTVNDILTNTSSNWNPEKKVMSTCKMAKTSDNLILNINVLKSTETSCTQTDKGSEPNMHSSITLRKFNSKKNTLSQRSATTTFSTPKLVYNGTQREPTNSNICGKNYSENKFVKLAKERFQLKPSTIQATSSPANRTVSNRAAAGKQKKNEPTSLIIAAKIPEKRIHTKAKAVSVQTVCSSVSRIRSCQTLSSRRAWADNCVQCRVSLVARSLQTLSEREPLCKRCRKLCEKQKSESTCIKTQSNDDFVVLYSSANQKNPPKKCNTNKSQARECGTFTSKETKPSSTNRHNAKTHALNWCSSHYSLRPVSISTNSLSNTLGNTKPMEECHPHRDNLCVSRLNKLAEQQKMYSERRTQTSAVDMQLRQLPKYCGSCIQKNVSVCCNINTSNSQTVNAENKFHGISEKYASTEVEIYCCSSAPTISLRSSDFSKNTADFWKYHHLDYSQEQLIFETDFTTTLGVSNTYEYHMDH